jgi:xyloglucan-specific endo-beta-1,4-glucanase
MECRDGERVGQGADKTRYSGAGDFTTNVAFDIFTGETADSAPAYEFMIWLGAFGGAGPISETGSPIASGVDLNGQSWDLFYGSHSQMEVYSFVASSGNIESFSGDLVDFTSYLVAEHGVDDSQVVQSVGAGTEPFVGTDVTFTTTSYAATVA